MPRTTNSKAATHADDGALWATDVARFAKEVPSMKASETTKETPASTKSVVKKPAAMQPTKKKAATKEAATKMSTTTLTRIADRKEVLLPGSHEEKSSSDSDTDTPNPGLITGDEASANKDSKAPGVTTSGEIPAANAASSGTTNPPEEPVPPAEAPKGRTPSPEDPSLQVDYEESGSGTDREAGDVEVPSVSPHNG
ncbi:hypothetical protein PF005_g5215 [Phytophthora fragariae]|uniref:Uncharacterized protein n=1 Tax=Phytophthora fragariae TaxID=53985 RepID=A0A6A3T8W9_9STRA|nr:hypothetical protein PF003_g10511 [Phytophthora fragariae]KAE8944708.1 hypothetical protein PF009_g5628 [Phytophthora fragariae]KAE9022964.1 hypothetical protein PF011_g4219 [Phytophthora fragariae]KAE9128073.1 hypothetical protein PF010_g4647 [Phytophthora fragariae]KAE9129256.1 hypothetical protein PF007_g4973 [Phytophthora fragariae]